jgi:hypothetical protein
MCLLIHGTVIAWGVTCEYPSHYAVSFAVLYGRSSNAQSAKPRSANARSDATPNATSNARFARPGAAQAGAAPFASKGADFDFSGTKRANSVSHTTPKPLILLERGTRIRPAEQILPLCFQIHTNHFSRNFLRMIFIQIAGCRPPASFHRPQG